MIMKKVIVFDVEKVLFNVKNVEKWLKGSDERLNGVSEFERVEELKKRESYLKGSVKKCRMYEGVKENVERLVCLRKSMEGRMKVFVVSKFGRRDVWNLLSENGIEVDGVYGSVGKMIDEWGIDERSVVYFCGEKGWYEGESRNVRSVFCKWGYEGVDVGMEKMDGMWREMGVRFGVEDDKGGDKEECSGGDHEVKENDAEGKKEVRLDKDNISEFKDIDVVGCLYRSPAGMSSDPGAVWIMDSEGRDIGFNQYDDGMDIEDAIKEIPSLAMNGLFSQVLYLGMGDSLSVDLYKWRRYERLGLPVREGSCYEGWKTAVEDMFRMLGERSSAA